MHDQILYLFHTGPIAALVELAKFWGGGKEVLHGAGELGPVGACVTDVSVDEELGVSEEIGGGGLVAVVVAQLPAVVRPLL